MPFDTLKYTRCAVIVHGKSEFHLVRFIYTNLHLPVKIISKDKGRGSIQINGLEDLLNKKYSTCAVAIWLGAAIKQQKYNSHILPSAL